jgi:hypothetical protein
MRKLRLARPQFLIWKRAIFRKVKEIKDLSGGVVLYAAQSNPPIDAEIVEKGRFRTKTSQSKGYLNVNLATFSTCGVCGNISTG